ncbi:MAG: MmcQ/YjbR family DNA-binding protein [Pelagimonas sp.]|jgi:predicted DNA-binding protein (MmcQ/YjbR family)|nr:MmcQ/YjbR family DNA-binding protein [Pelagimonas sp.]
MSSDLVDDICRALPGAEWADPADGALASWKVGGKMFACTVTDDKGVSVKTPSIEDASLLIEMGRARKAPYFHRSWVRVYWEEIPQDELRDRLTISYEIVFKSLTKKLQREILGERS